MSQKLIYHITSARQWHDAKLIGTYQPTDFVRDGFIHCSYSHQLLTVAHHLYRGQDGLVVLLIDSSKIDSRPIEENLEGGRELFPHLYSVLPVDAVVEAIAFPCNADGSFTLPEELKV